MTSCALPPPHAQLHKHAREWRASHYSPGQEAQPLLAKDEAARLLDEMRGEPGLVARLLYATGMSLPQALGLRVKDVDLGRNLIVVQRRPGGSRLVHLPRALAAGLRRQMATARAAWEADHSLGHCGVEIPHALQDKHPQANQGWSWFWVFPSPACAAGAAATGACGPLGIRSVEEEIARAARACGLSLRVCARCLSWQRRLARPQAVPPTVSPSMRSVGWPTPTGTLWPSLPQVPTPVSSFMSLPIMLTRVNASGPLPTMVAPFTG
jgi:hypothetical protein